MAGAAGAMLRPPLACWLLMLATVNVQPLKAADHFPLKPLVLPPECSCAERSGHGWVGVYEMCMKGISTPCELCPYQKKCATVSTVVGDGVRAFLGDCRSGTDSCLTGEESSLAFPISVAIDQQDNLYISDYGNNRIRKWDQSTNSVTTIAGTGEMGFSGDGGPARSARIRQPEGIALKPGLPAHALEVYFSDFKNQRIRRLSLRGGIWYIDTIAGNGVRGDSGVACDIGCSATTEATLDNPRSLAFSSTQDLYIADSGNRKIRRLTPAGVFSTFVGLNGSGAPELTPFTEIGSRLLPGHFSQPNHAGIGKLYFINIDNEDNLWFVDGPDNRIWHTPLVSRTRTSIKDPFRVLQENFMLHFATTPGEVAEMEPGVVAGLQAWLAKEFNVTAPETETWQPQSGRSQWTYGSGVQGSWCASADACPPFQAQYAPFGSIMGFCFDAANNFYISDTGSSELLYLTRHVVNVATTFQTAEASFFTTKNCRCFQYWYDDQLVDDSASPFNGDPDKAKMCQENPEVIALAQQGLLAHIEFVPKCTTTQYCEDKTYGVPRCFTEHDSSEQCDVANWGFCSKPGLGVSFGKIPYASILGYEMRMKLVLNVTEITWAEIEGALTKDLWFQPRGRDMVTESSEYGNTSILLGFLPAGPQPASCSSRCCGLEEHIAEDLESGPMCVLKTLEDLPVVNEFFLEQQTLEIVFNKLDNITAIHASADTASMKLEDCQDRCMLDSMCQSFMVAYNVSSERAAETSACVYFTRSYPYHTYVLNRSSIDDAAVLSADEVARIRRDFFTQTGEAAYSRLFNPTSTAALYVTEDGRHTSSMLPQPAGGPHPQAALRLHGCQDLCIRTVDCYAIAFPGCYLLNVSFHTMARDAAETHGVVTAVYVKQNLDPKVEGIAGSRNVKAFYGEGAKLKLAYVNRPQGCVVNSKGDLLFTDVWNQRIRKITGYNQNCMFSIDSSARQAYKQAIDKVDATCSAVPWLDNLYERMQQEVVQNQSTKLVTEHLCEFRAPDPVDVDYLETNNTLVLCKICGQLWSNTSAGAETERPDICPWVELCQCRDSIREAMVTQAYRLCPKQNAYHDEWHRWISSYVQCWAQNPREAEWLSEGKAAQLRSQLQSYTRRRRLM